MSPTTRSIADYFKSGQDTLSGNGMSFFDSTNYNFHNIGFGRKDDRFDLPALFNVLMNEPIWFGTFQKIEGLLKTSGWEIYEIKKNGKKEITRPAREYKRKLIEHGWKQAKRNLLSAAYGLGLGGGVAYKVKEKGKLKLCFDPYILDGMPRVAFWSPQYNPMNIVEEVEILDGNAREVLRMPFDKVYHYQFSNPNSTPGFGTNGVVTAAKWIRLKYNIMTANDAVFSGGMHINKVASLDLVQMQKMGATKTQIDNATNLLQERLSQANGLRNAGRLMWLPFPMQFQDIAVTNNSQMRTAELIKDIERQVYFAMGVDPAILDTGKAKYNNIDQAVDQLYQSVQSFIADEQNLAEEFALPAIDPNFDNTRFIYRIPRQFSQEEIKIKEVKSKETSVFFQNLKTGNESLSGFGLAVLPTEEQLKLLEEQGMTVETLGKEKIVIKPSTENQLADEFTQLTNGENVRQAEKKDLGCVMAMYEQSQFDKIKSLINKDDLFVDSVDYTKNGFPTDFHTTLLYGLLPTVNRDEVFEKLNADLNETGQHEYLDYNGFTLLMNQNIDKIKVKKIELFEKPEYDILVLAMEEKPFEYANTALKRLPYENDFPDYKPHTTIAYLKKGTGKKYLSMKLPDLDFSVKDIVYTPAESKETINLISNQNQRKSPSFYESLENRLNTAFQKVLA